jgi:hypothetical protein
MCGNGYGYFQRFFFYIVVLPVLLSVSGRTPLWSQSSELSSNSSAGHLATWNILSERFSDTLNLHEQTLQVLWKNLGASESNGERLTRLSGELSKQNESLKTYNGQIAERMQERDEDLAASYEANDRKDKTILKLIIVIIVLGVPYLIKAALWIAGKFKA